MANEIGKDTEYSYCLFDFCVLALCGCRRPSFGPKNCVCLSAESHCFLGVSDAKDWVGLEFNSMVWNGAGLALCACASFEFSMASVWDSRVLTLERSLKMWSALYWLGIEILNWIFFVSAKRRTCLNQYLSHLIFWCIIKNTRGGVVEAILYLVVNPYMKFSIKSRQSQLLDFLRDR